MCCFAGLLVEELAAVYFKSTLQQKAMYLENYLANSIYNTAVKKLLRFP